MNHYQCRMLEFKGGWGGGKTLTEPNNATYRKGLYFLNVEKLFFSFMAERGLLPHICLGVSNITECLGVSNTTHTPADQYKE